MRKVVLYSLLSLDGAAEEHVRGLREHRDGGDIGIHGSITLAQSLAAAGLLHYATSD